MAPTDDGPKKPDHSKETKTNQRMQAGRVADVQVPGDYKNCVILSNTHIAAGRRIFNSKIKEQKLRNKFLKTENRV